MDIKSAIYNLLFLNDCVVIPGFGAFVTDYKPAEFADSGRTLRPPSKAIRFNIDLKTNDGILVHYVSQKEGISFQDCRDDIDHQVERWNSALYNKRIIRFPGVGSLLTDKNEKIIFTPDKETNFLPESHGLQSFDLELLNKREDQEDNIRTGFSTISLAKKALLATPVLIAIALIPLKTDFLKNEHINTASLHTFTWVPEIKHAKQNPVPNKTLILKDIIITPEVKNEVVKVADKKDYFVIVGTFKNYSNAQERLNFFLKKKLHARLHNTEDGLYRVSIYSFDNEAAAEDKCQKLIARGIDAFVMTKPH